MIPRWRTEGGSGQGLNFSFIAAKCNPATPQPLHLPVQARLCSTSVGARCLLHQGLIWVPAAGLAGSETIAPELSRGGSGGDQACCRWSLKGILQRQQPGQGLLTPAQQVKRPSLVTSGLSFTFPAPCPTAGCSPHNPSAQRDQKGLGESSQWCSPGLRGRHL